MVILYCSPARSGKDTIADMTRDYFEEKNQPNIVRYSFAHQLKIEAEQHILNQYGLSVWDDIKKEIFRPYLIEFGKRKRDETDGMFLIQKFLDAYISSYTYIISDYRFINEYQELNKRLRKKVYPIYIERVREDGSIIEPVIEDEIREYGKIRDEAIIWQIPWYEDRGSIMGGHWKDELKKDVYSYLDYLLSPSCDETHT